MCSIRNTVALNGTLVASSPQGLDYRLATDSLVFNRLAWPHVDQSNVVFQFASHTACRADCSATPGEERDARLGAAQRHELQRLRVPRRADRGRRRLLGNRRRVDAERSPVRLVGMAALHAQADRRRRDLKRLRGERTSVIDERGVKSGAQVERDGNERCFGVSADDDMIAVSEYGCNGSDPVLILYKKRSI